MRLADGTDYRLDPDVKKRWVDALRSGKFAQGTGCLKFTWTDSKFPNQYCCLGVHAEEERLWKKIDQGQDGSYLVTKEENYELIHSEDGDISNMECSIMPGEVQGKLARMNDDEKSFKYIAAYIERYL